MELAGRFCSAGPGLLGLSGGSAPQGGYPGNNGGVGGVGYAREGDGASIFPDHRAPAWWIYPATPGRGIGAGGGGGWSLSSIYGNIQDMPPNNGGAGMNGQLIISYTPVPEPSTIALLLTASLGGLLWWRRRR
jgi:hypothetical protein